jgi:formylmethanofuran dehydrogenase subunit A
MEIKKIKNEDPRNAWPEEYIRVKDKVVLDLGCGFFGLTNTFKSGTMQWANIKLPDMISTSEYFLNLGAKMVIGVDSNSSDIEYLINTIGNTNRSLFFGEEIRSPQKIEELINKYNIEIIKSDIEGQESNLLGMNDNVFKSIKEYYVETHTSSVHEEFLKKFNIFNYNIREIMAVGDAASPLVIFAYQK